MDMAGVTKIMHRGKEILFVDYKGTSGDDEMIAVLRKAQAIVISDNKPYLQLTDITGAYSTKKFTDELKKVGAETPKLAIKRAVVGITPMKKIILMGYNMVLGRSNALRPFNSLEEAKDYLVS